MVVKLLIDYKQMQRLRLPLTYGLPQACIVLTPDKSGQAGNNGESAGFIFSKDGLPGKQANRMHADK